MKHSDFLVDLGSYDGTLLTGFKDHGMKVLGVEPTNIARIANQNGVETTQKFFNIKTANEIKNKHGKVSLILATNMFAHMSTIGEVISGIEILLKDDGVFVFENHCLLLNIRTFNEHLLLY